MTTKDDRDLRESITAYRDNLLKISVQVADLVELLERGGKMTDAGRNELNGAVRLYAIVADDLTRLLDGEQLRPFAVAVDL